MEFIKKLFSFIFTLCILLVFSLALLTYINDGEEGFKPFFPFNAMDKMVEDIYLKHSAKFEPSGDYHSELHSDLSTPIDYADFEQVIDDIYFSRPFNTGWSFVCDASLENRDCYQISYNPFATSAFTLINAQGKEVTVNIDYALREKRWVVKSLEVSDERIALEGVGEYFYETVDLLELCASNSGTSAERFYCGAYGQIFQRLRDEPGKLADYQNLLLESGRMAGHDFSEIKLFVPNEKAIAFLKNKNSAAE